MLWASMNTHLHNTLSLRTRNGRTSTAFNPAHLLTLMLAFVLVLLMSWQQAWAQVPSAQTLLATVPGPPAPVGIPHGPMVLLWPEGAPGAVGTTDADKPRLEVFAAAGKGPHTAVIVCPGGGYTNLAYDKEGTRVAEWLNLQGVTAYVLTYRLSPRYHYPAPIADGERAVRLVRSHAEEYGVAGDKIGLFGFSAGAHLAAIVATHFDAGDPAAKDAVDRVSDRPDFVISAYGRLALDPAYNPANALQTLLGDNPAPGLRDEMSAEKHVTAQTPPFFIYATTADQTVSSLTSDAFYAALKKAGVPAEMHIFEQGPHGTGLGEKYLELAVWPELAAHWMQLHGWLPEPVK